jgi:hypothetical protein
VRGTRAVAGDAFARQEWGEAVEAFRAVPDEELTKKRAGLRRL